jgi:hypothetical protein
MFRPIAYATAVLTIIFILADRATALVIRQSVTPASVQEKESRFSITAERRKDGLIHFTITYRLPRPQYLVAHFEVREGEATVLKTDTPSFVHESSATYDIALSPRRLADSKFELSENAFGESGGQPVALPGGTIYQIDLEASFANED